MIRFDRFFEGKTHAVIFSFDDARTEDRRLVEILNRYGLKATFHINSGKLDSKRNITTNELMHLYKNHEIALHGQSHARLSTCHPIAIIKELLDDRVALEKITENIITGFAYPYGDVNDVAYNSIKSCGIEYARTTNNTLGCKFPQDFLLWNPSCHMYNADSSIEHFFNKMQYPGDSPLLLIWGHSFELERDNKWDNFESLCKKVSNISEVWYTTCADFLSYNNAVKSLRVSADETKVENPSGIPVWISVNNSPLKIGEAKQIKLEARG